MNTDACTAIAALILAAMSVSPAVRAAVWTPAHTASEHTACALLSLASPALDEVAIVELADALEGEVRP